MKKVAPLPDLDEELPFKQLTADEASRLREQQPQRSPWWVVTGQVGVGIVVASAAGVLTGRQTAVWSAAYGAMAVVLPAAIFARVLTAPRVAGASPTGAVARFFLWEVIKVALTVVLLAVAPKIVTALSWPAMLAGLVLTMQVYWVALAVGSRNVKRRVE
jgi:ATP synthase protein I